MPGVLARRICCSTNAASRLSAWLGMDMDENPLPFALFV
jgi:hypothetical protein